jgi:disintegrin and metalloproteinase domain-containing protein 10
MGSVASNSRGGICEKPAKDIYEGQRVMKTLNTGMITVINHNTRTSSLMTELTFAHEVGHNLGAEHDDEKCGGDATYGHYIMYRRATTGLEENNNKFSNCSMDKMGPVVISVKNQLAGKINCLTECSQVGYCGNRNVEDDEECDCGFISECTDDCCYPAGGPDAKLGCKLKPGARCSPSKGPCCSDQCSFHPSTHICHKDKASQDCLGDVRCDGVQATCPLNDTQFFKPIDTPCNQNTQLCDRGECNKSICTLITKTECTLTIPNMEDPLRQRGVDREYLCHIGCFDSRTNSCVDTLALRMPNNHSKSGFGYKHRPGHACAGTAGYCDVFGKCRAVDAEGPLTRLKNMLLNEENIRTLTQLTQEYWWAFVLGILGLIGLMSIFVKICSVHTPSSNPRLKPARSLSLKRGSHGPRPHSANHSRQPISSSSVTGTELTSLQQQPKRQPKVFVRGSNSSDKQQIRLQQNKNKSSRL